nr:MAG TPA: hypothetical protein [Caudoviricetes sp.]
MVKAKSSLTYAHYNLLKLINQICKRKIKEPIQGS